MKKQIVVARYKEDVSWLNGIDIPTVVYNKGSARLRFKRPVSLSTLYNVGREAHTYLWHIVHNYNNLADITIFTQADPFMHAPDFLDRIMPDYADTTSLATRYAPTKSMNIASKSDFVFQIEGFEVRYGKIDLYAQSGLVYNRKWFALLWDRLFEPRCKPNDSIFGYAAIYSVPRHRITDRPLTFYRYCLEQTEIYPGLLNAYAFEALWYYIWSDNDRYPIVDRYGDEPLPPDPAPFTDVVRWRLGSFFRVP